MLFPSRRQALAFGACATLTFTLAAGVTLAASGSVSVTIKNFDFQPMDVTVPVGASVTWKNLDEEPHTVTSTDGGFHSAALDEGDTYQFRFAKPGVYKYLCTIHPRMVATVTVK